MRHLTSRGGKVFFARPKTVLRLALMDALLNLMSWVPTFEVKNGDIAVVSMTVLNGFSAYEAKREKFPP